MPQGKTRTLKTAGCGTRRPVNSSGIKTVFVLPSSSILKIQFTQPVAGMHPATEVGMKPPPDGRMFSYEPYLTWKTTTGMNESA